MDVPCMKVLSEEETYLCMSDRLPGRGKSFHLDQECPGTRHKLDAALQSAVQAFSVLSRLRTLPYVKHMVFIQVPWSTCQQSTSTVLRVYCTPVL